MTSDGSVNSAVAEPNLLFDGSSLTVTGSIGVSGDVTVGGILYAQEFHTELISASIIFESGSTKFGNSFDDTHQFTGSVNISGSLTINGSTTKIGDQFITGSLYISGAIAYPDYIDFNINPPQSISATQEGRLSWDTDNRSLVVGVGNNVDIHVGQQEFAYVVNAESTTLTKGEVVYISGSQGNTLAVKRAANSAEQGSAGTLGLVNESILSGAEGLVITSGLMRKHNTTGLIAGKPIYLSSTPGVYTQTKPIGPQHTVILGYVSKIDTNQGEIFIKVDNGYELDELHNVLDTSTTASYGDLLVRSGSLWINSKQLTGSYGVTGSIEATSFTGSFTGSFRGISYTTGSLTGSFIGTGTGSFSGSFYGASFTTGSLTGSFIGESTGSFTGSFRGTSLTTGSLTGSFVGEGTGSFTGSFRGISNTTGSLTGSFIGEGTGSFTGSFRGVSYTTGSLTGSFFGESYSTGSLTGSFRGEGTGSFTGSFRGVSYTTGSLTGSFMGEGTGSFTGSFTGSLNGNFNGIGTGSFTGSLTGISNTTGSLSGSFKGGSIQQGGNPIYYLDSGRYTPVITGSYSECTGYGLWGPTIIEKCAQWIRVGDVITVSGEVLLNVENNTYPNNYGVFVALSVTLPFLPDNGTTQKFTDSCQLAGTAVSSCGGVGGGLNAMLYGRIYGETQGDGNRAIIEMEQPILDDLISLHYHFTYTRETSP